MKYVYFKPREAVSESAIIITSSNPQEPVGIMVDPMAVEGLLRGKDGKFTEIGMRSGEKYFAVNYDITEVAEMLGFNY